MNQELHTKRPCFGSRHILRIGVASLFFVSMAASVGAATTTGKDDDQGGAEETLVRWHGYLSEKVETLGEAADKVFDADIVFQEINQTSVRVRFDIDAIEGRDVEFNPKLDIKWVLPAAERRWSLLIQSEDDFDSDAGNLGEPLLGDDDRGSAALRSRIRAYSGQN